MTYICKVPAQSLPLLFLGLSLFVASAKAQSDRIYPHSGSTIQGVVKAITKDAVKIQVGANTQDVPSNTIRRILFEGDPAGGVGKARDQILDGQYDSGLAELQKVDLKKIERDEIKAEYSYFKAYAMAKLALAGRADKPAAVKAMMDFVQQNPASWHFYDAAEALGDLAMALGSPENATKYYGALAAAPFPEYKLKAAYLEGLALLKSNKASDALQRFDALVNAKVTTPEGVRYQKMASAGRVEALAKSGQADKALEVLPKLIQENDPTDIEASARLYNAQAVAALQKNDVEGALLAYLHTDLLFSAATDAHTDALKQLIELWNKLGQPDRADATRSKLKRLYPGA